MRETITCEGVTFAVENVPGISKSFITLPGDHLILPIDSGCRFGVEEHFPEILGTCAFNSRELMLGMILLERSGKYLALAPTDSIPSRCRVTETTPIFSKPKSPLHVKYSHSPDSCPR